MGSEIGKLFRSARARLGMSLGEVVRRAGLVRISKWANKLVMIERGEDPFPARHLLERFAPVLGLTEEDVTAALCEEFRRQDEPIEPEAVVRLMPAVYLRLQLPEGVSPEEAVRLAERHSAETGRKVFVRLSNIRGVYIQPDGSSFEDYDIPWSSLGGAPGALRPWLRDRSSLNASKRLGDTVLERGTC